MTYLVATENYSQPTDELYCTDSLHDGFIANTHAVSVNKRYVLIPLAGLNECLSKHYSTFHNLQIACKLKDFCNQFTCASTDTVTANNNHSKKLSLQQLLYSILTSDGHFCFLILLKIKVGPLNCISEELDYALSFQKQ